MKTIIMSLIIIFSFEGGATLQNQCFEEANSVEEMFDEAYRSSKILGWGLTSHEDFRPQEMLSKFLDNIGMDENLKYLFVEIPAVSREIFEHISLFGNAALPEANQILGGYAEYFLSPYKMSNYQSRVDFLLIYKKIFELNKKRTKKLLIVPIDTVYGINTQKLHNPLSFDREFSTAQNFNHYLETMADDEKGIVLYHSYHLAQKIEGHTYNYRNSEYQLSEVSFMGLSNLDSQDFSLITFDTPAQRPRFGRLFETVFSPTANSITPLKVRNTAKSSNCLNSNSYYNSYVEDVSFPERMIEAFSYVVYLN